MDSNAELTLVLLKPDAVEQRLQRIIETSIRNAGLKILARRKFRFTPEMVKMHYPHRAKKPYFKSIVAFMTRGPCLAMIVGGTDAIAIMREIIGDPDPRRAATGTLRRMYGRVTSEDAYENVIHGSSSVETAPEEIIRFFDPDAPDG